MRALLSAWEPNVDLFSGDWIGWFLFASALMLLWALATRVWRVMCWIGRSLTRKE